MRRHARQARFVVARTASGLEHRFEVAGAEDFEWLLTHLRSIEDEGGEHVVCAHVESWRVEVWDG